MYNWDDVLILGDSFCGNRSNKNHWPQIVTCSLTGSEFDQVAVPRGRGFPGGSWWSVRKEFLKSAPCKVAVFCHTEPMRLPNDNDWGINTRSVELKQIHKEHSVDQPMPEDFAVAARLYYEQLISIDYHEWAITQWFKELDELLVNVEKSVHLFCFSGPYNNYTFKNGVTLSQPLIQYQRKNPIFRKAAFAPNHFTLDDNVKFAKSILDVINNYPGHGHRIDNKLI
jgi:hypothetical protein